MPLLKAGTGSPAPGLGESMNSGCPMGRKERKSRANRVSKEQGQGSWC